MIRTLWFLLKVALLVAAAVWVASHPGQVFITWQGYEITMSVGVLALIVLVLSGVAMLAFTLWRALVSVPRSLSLGHLSRRQRKGYLALTQGMVAVAAGDAVAAQRLAGKAHKLLKEPGLTLLLQAQAAQLSGDDAGAARYFSTMLERPEMSFLGLRGLIMSALRKGQINEALSLGYRALKLQPKAGWLLALLSEMEARAGNWSKAQDHLAKALKQSAVAQDRATSLRVTYWLGQAAAEEKAGNISAALALAERAHNQMPGFVPAALAVAKLQLSSKHHKKAMRALERCWQLSPHPQVAALYLDTVSAEPGRSVQPLELVRHLEKLTTQKPTSEAGKVALAQAAVKAELWGLARGCIGTLLESDSPSEAVCLLMADLEEKDNKDHKVAQNWRLKAVQAPASPQWTCQSCHVSSPEWAPVCGSCGSVGSQLWQTYADKISFLPPVSA